MKPSAPVTLSHDAYIKISIYYWTCKICTLDWYIIQKRNSHLITYASGDHETQVDYILFRKGLRKYIRDVKVIPGEECLTQHRLLVCIFKIAAVPRVKRKFTPRLRT